MRPGRGDRDQAGGAPVTSVLVTGGAGYLGTLALDALADRGIPRLLSLDVTDPRRTIDGVHYEAADIRTADLDGLLTDHEVDAVVHLAAIVNPPPGMDDATLHDIEVGGTQRVLAACIEADVRHITIASSGAAYGYHPRNRGHLLTEDDPVPGSTDFAYSRHKAEVEALAARYRQQHPALTQLVLRPGTVLGDSTDNLITDLFTLPVVLGLRGAEVPFVFIWDRDVAEVIARGVVAEREGIYNLAGDGVVTLRDIATMEGKPFVALPVGLLRGGLGLLSQLRLTQYGPEQVDFLRYRPVLDNSRMRADFPGLPRYSSREVYERYQGARARRSVDG
ncbi:MAG: NAD-dependent epimerase/dehydratase family protein [Nitriliruptorales bacterium]|nr:NAD-dependent epimerase/dehydratase family protein [Nitriliruptorales bacterium]